MRKEFVDFIAVEDEADRLDAMREFIVEEMNELDKALEELHSDHMSREEAEKLSYYSGKMDAYSTQLSMVVQARLMIERRKNDNGGDE